MLLHTQFYFDSIISLSDKENKNYIQNEFNYLCREYILRNII